MTRLYQCFTKQPAYAASLFITLIKPQPEAGDCQLPMYNGRMRMIAFGFHIFISMKRIQPLIRLYDGLFYGRRIFHFILQGPIIVSQSPPLRHSLRATKAHHASHIYQLSSILLLTKYKHRHDWWHCWLLTFLSFSLANIRIYSSENVMINIESALRWVYKARPNISLIFILSLWI